MLVKYSGKFSRRLRVNLCLRFSYRSTMTATDCTNVRFDTVSCVNTIFHIYDISKAIYTSLFR